MNLIQSEVVAAIVGPLVLLLIGKAFAWWEKRAREKGDTDYAKAVSALEVGVQDAWVSLGKTWKAAQKDGKFSDDEKAGLRQRAITIAREVGRAAGVDVVKAIGLRAIPLIIKKIVDRRKRGSA